MSKSSEDRFTVLLVAFAGLPAHQQARFLELLNQYLFASPQRRRQYVRAWARRNLDSGRLLCGLCEQLQEANPNAS